MKKRVYIVESHHHVIKEWFRYKNQGVHLLSFDYHTDFQTAFSRKGGDPLAFYEFTPKLHNSYLNKHIPCYDIDAAIKDLRHDEHIDFALRCAIIEKAYVFSCESNTFDDERMIDVSAGCICSSQSQVFSYAECYHPIVRPTHYDDKNVVWMAKNNTTDEVLTDVMEVFQKYGFNQDNYILDIDCDFIRDKAAMCHSNLNVLEKLIKGAKAITIAREPECVAEVSDCKLTSDKIENWLIDLIKKSCICGVYIEKSN